MRRMAGLWAALLLVLALTPTQAGAVELPIRAEAALLMEKETGQVLYAQNEHEALEPASVTKVMTLLLTMEAIEKGSLHYADVEAALFAGQPPLRRCGDGQRLRRLYGRQPCLPVGG